MILISIKQIPKREQHAHAHLLLSRCLKESGVDYASDETPVVLGEHGKPSLAEYPALHYNISHADGIAAAMVSAQECGIDCECLRTYDPRIMKRAFSEKERNVVENASAGERELLFFSLWTLKEAYVKALGKGLVFPLRKAEFTFDGDMILTNLTGCTFVRYIINRRAVVSACVLAESRKPNASYYLHTADDIITIRKTI